MWQAMDGDGWWHWYELEPEWEESENRWNLNASEDNSWYEISGFDESDIDWDHAWVTKEQRPSTTTPGREG